jgi:hypothetical protein
MTPACHFHGTVSPMTAKGCHHRATSRMGLQAANGVPDQKSARYFSHATVTP